MIIYRLIITIILILTIILFIGIIISKCFKGGGGAKFTTLVKDEVEKSYIFEDEVPVYEVYNNKYTATLEYYSMIGNESLVFKIGLLTGFKNISYDANFITKQFTCYPPLHWTPKYEQFELTNIDYTNIKSTSKLNPWGSELATHYTKTGLRTSVQLYRIEPYHYIPLINKFTNELSVKYHPQQIIGTSKIINNYGYLLGYNLTDAEKYFHMKLFEFIFKTIFNTTVIENRVVLHFNENPIKFCHVGTFQFTKKNVNEFTVSTWDSEMNIIIIPDSMSRYLIYGMIDEYMTLCINDYIRSNECLDNNDDYFYGGHKSNKICGGRGCRVVDASLTIDELDRNFIENEKILEINGYHFRDASNRYIVKFGVVTTNFDTSYNELIYHIKNYRKMNFNIKTTYCRYIIERNQALTYTNNVVLILQYLLDYIEQFAHQTCYDTLVEEVGKDKVTRFSDSNEKILEQDESKDKISIDGYSENISTTTNAEFNDDEIFRKINSQIKAQIYDLLKNEVCRPGAFNENHEYIAVYDKNNNMIFAIHCMLLQFSDNEKEKLYAL